MTINGRTTVSIDGQGDNIDVAFQVPSQRLEIVIPFASQKSLKAVDFLYAK